MLLPGFFCSIPETIACLSTYVELCPGDLIMMGTPDGVGPVKPGDTVEGWIDGIATLKFTVSEQARARL